MSSLPSWYVAERVAQATALSTEAVMAREERAAQDVPQVVGECVEMVQTISQARVDDQTVDVAVPLILESLIPREPTQQWLTPSSSKKRVAQRIMNIIDVSMLKAVEGIVEVVVPQIFEGGGGDSASASVVQPSTNGAADGAFSGWSRREASACFLMRHRWTRAFFAREFLVGAAIDVHWDHA